MSEKMKIGCVILAGGKSSRMGEDKALLDFNGKSFIEKIQGEFLFFEEKMLASGNRRGLLMGNEDGWKEIPDVYEDHGPLGGLHAVLAACDSDAMFCVSCDMPFITGELAKTLVNAFTEEDDAVVAVTKDMENGEERVHPLCAVYHKRNCALMEEHLKENNNRLMAVLRKIQVKYVYLGLDETKQVANINTKDDYKNLIH